MKVLNLFRAWSVPPPEEDPDLLALMRLEQPAFIQKLAEALRVAGYTVDPHSMISASGDLMLRRRGERTWLSYRHWRKRRVGRRAVRELHETSHAAGAAGCTVITCGFFDARALDYASDKPIELLGGPKLLTAMPSLRCADPTPAPVEPVSELTESATGESRVFAGGLGEIMPREAQPARICPRCGRTMQLYVAEGGRAEGREFWACENYPVCKGTRPV